MSAVSESIAQRVTLGMLVERYGFEVDPPFATNVTISIGMTPLMDSDIDGALKRADTALYEAKGQGRNIILAS